MKSPNKRLPIKRQRLSIQLHEAHDFEMVGILQSLQSDYVDHITYNRIAALHYADIFLTKIDIDLYLLTKQADSTENC